MSNQNKMSIIDSMMNNFSEVFDSGTDTSEITQKFGNGGSVTIKNPNTTITATDKEEADFIKKIDEEYAKVKDNDTNGTGGVQTIMPDSEFFDDYANSAEYSETMNDDGSFTFTPIDGVNPAPVVDPNSPFESKTTVMRAIPEGQNTVMDTVDQMYDGADQSVIDSTKGLQYGDTKRDVASFGEAFNASNKGILRGLPEAPGALFDVIADHTINPVVNKVSDWVGSDYEMTPWDSQGTIKDATDSIFGEAEQFSEDGSYVGDYSDKGRELGVNAGAAMIPIKVPKTNIKTKIQKQELKAAIKNNEPVIKNLQKNVDKAQSKYDIAKGQKASAETVQAAKDNVVKAKAKVDNLKAKEKASRGTKKNIDDKLKLKTAQRQLDNARSQAKASNLNGANNAAKKAAKKELDAAKKELQAANKINNQSKRNLNSLENTSKTSAAANETVATGNAVLRDKISIFEQGLTSVKNTAKSTAKSTKNVAKTTKQLFPHTSKAMKATAVMANAEKLRAQGINPPNAKEVASSISKALENEMAANALNDIANSKAAAEQAVLNRAALEAEHGIDLGKALFQVAVASLMGFSLREALGAIGHNQEEARKHRQKLEEEGLKQAEKLRTAQAKLDKELRTDRKAARKDALDRNLKHIADGGFKHGEQSLLNSQLYGLFAQLDKLGIDYGRNDVQEGISRAVGQAKMALGKGGWFDSEDQQAAKANLTGKFFESVLISSTDGHMSNDGEYLKDELPEQHAGFAKWMLQQKNPEAAVQQKKDEWMRFRNAKKNENEKWYWHNNFTGWAMNNLYQTR